MKLPWSLCPYCGTPEPGKRREDISVKEAVQSVEIKELDELDKLNDLDDEVLISEL